ncbi:unnamed protein product [Brassicogethes aeneus]|uniref:Rieske domain-containing protein n=1 Tax=Brassicogethes aeneus TaxID=1431903 RepID=A0A9P0AS63_BRAAE|nr:unnamed protein product [Brassicogethes aeneus]
MLSLFYVFQKLTTAGLNEITNAFSGPIDDDEYVEKVLCKTTDLEENQMKSFDVDEGKVVLIKQNGKFAAIGPKCTHYGAPLVNGALGEGRVRCQWHGACFNIWTGDIEDFPGLDSIPCHEVTVDGCGNVAIRAKKSELRDHKRVKPMAKRECAQTQSMVIIGGGPAGANCVEVLRQEGFQGKITMVCKENYLPYDRVKVSKAMDFDIETAQLRSEKFYQQNGIEVIKGVAAKSVDTTSKKVTLDNEKTIAYDKLFVATGCKPRKVDIPGKDLANVLTLRNYDDAKFTVSLLAENKEMVVLGSSFVAMESANFCHGKVGKITIVARVDYPFSPYLGPCIGQAVRALYEEKGITFVPNSGIKKINGCSSVESVELNDGTILKCDVLIMGTGSDFNTDFLRNSGVNLEENGSVDCDDHLRSNVADVYVGGDIAFAPVWSHGNEKSAIGHWPLAHYHGKIAALNMLGKNAPLKTVPFFWSMLFGKGLRYCGHGRYDDIIYQGDVQGFKFVAFYLNKEGLVIAAASVGMDPVVSQVAEMMAQGKKITRDDLQGDDKLKWIERLHQK